MRKIGDILNENYGSVYKDFLRITKIWSETMTANIAEVTCPVKMDGKTLTVLVRDNIWLTELNYLKEEIKEKLLEKGLEVEDLSFKYRPHYEKVRKIKRPAYEITMEKQIYIDEIIKNIDNEDTRTLLKKAMTAYFKRYSIKEFING